MVLLNLFRPEWSQRLNSFRVEASWKLGKWDDLETYLKEVKTVYGDICLL